MTDDLKTIWQQLHKDTVGRELSDDLPDLDAARSCARPDLGRRLDRAVRAGRPRPGSGSCSMSRTTSSTEPRPPLKARSTCSTCSATSAQVSSGRSASPTRSSMSVEATTSSSAAWPRTRRRDRNGDELVRSSHERRDLHADVPGRIGREDGDRRPRCPGTAVLVAALGRLVEGRFHAVKATAISELGMGTNSKLHLQFKKRLWSDLGSNGETYSDRGYQTTWEVSRAQARNAGHPRGLHRGDDRGELGSGTPTCGRSRFLPRSSLCCPGRRHSGTAGRRSTSGPETSGRGARIRTGRSASTRVRGRRGRAHRELPLRRRAHLAGLAGIPERGRRIRRASGLGDPRRAEVIGSVAQFTHCKGSSGLPFPLDRLRNLPTPIRGACTPRPVGNCERRRVLIGTLSDETAFERRHRRSSVH